MGPWSLFYSWTWFDIDKAEPLVWLYIHYRRYSDICTTGPRISSLTSLWPLMHNTLTASPLVWTSAPVVLERGGGGGGPAPGPGWTSCGGVRDKWREGCWERAGPCEEMRVWAWLRHPPFRGSWHPYRLSYLHGLNTHTHTDFKKRNFFPLSTCSDPKHCFYWEQRHLVLSDHL